MSTSNRSKGQTSLEFVAMLSFLMLAFTASYAVFAQKQASAIEYRNRLQASAIADRAAYEMDLALAQGDGYRRNFTLPVTLHGIDYNISASGKVIRVSWRDRRVFARTPASLDNVTLQPGDNHVENRGGVLYGP